MSSSNTNTASDSTAPSDSAAASYVLKTNADGERIQGVSGGSCGVYVNEDKRCLNCREAEFDLVDCQYCTRCVYMLGRVPAYTTTYNP